MTTPVLADIHFRGYSRVTLNNSCNCNSSCCFPFRRVVRRNRTTEMKIKIVADDVYKQERDRKTEVKLP